MDCTVFEQIGLYTEIYTAIRQHGDWSGTIAKYTRLTATHMACDSEGQRCAVVYSMDMSRMWSQSMYICWKGGNFNTGAVA